MIYTLINFLCSLVEGVSYYMFMCAKFKHQKKNKYFDILLVLFIGIFYGLLNDYGTAPLGTILGLLTQLIWAHFVLDGKFAQKCFLSCLWWSIFLTVSDWLVLTISDLAHISGDIPIIAALPDYPDLRANLMITSKFLLIFITMIYVHFCQRHRQPAVVASKFILFLTGIFYISTTSLLCALSLNKVDIFDSINRFALRFPITTSIVYAFAVILFSILYRINITSYNYEKLLQKNKLEKQHYENMKLLEQELTDLQLEMLNHFKYMKQLATDGDYDTLKNKAGTQNLFSTDDYILTGNAVFDLVLKQKINYGRQKNIPFQINIQKMGTLTMEDTDIVCLFSNLLDNACEACEALPPPKTLCIS
ncbi:MAG: GHKL domain-containing protein [Ruminococcus flavefaciens]|nr:GHKL domain-containing protein [Ruminococcus flavefaciens]